MRLLDQLHRNSELTGTLQKKKMVIILELSLN